MIQTSRFIDNGGRVGRTDGGFQAHAPGVYIAGGGGCMVSNNFFRNNFATTTAASRAMLIWIAGSTAQRHVGILGNRISVPSSGASGYGATESSIIGSHSSSTDTYLSITGNQIQFPGVAETAIRIASPFALVTDNFIRGGTGSGHALDVFGANCHVENNFVKSTTVAANIPIQYDFVDTGSVTRTIVINKVHPLP